MCIRDRTEVFVAEALCRFQDPDAPTHGEKCGLGSSGAQRAFPLAAPLIRKSLQKAYKPHLFRLPSSQDRLYEVKREQGQAQHSADVGLADAFGFRQVVEGRVPPLWSETTRLDVRVAEVADPRPGDRIVVDGDAFVVQGEPVRDRERLVWTLDARPV